LWAVGAGRSGHCVSRALVRRFSGAKLLLSLFLVWPIFNKTKRRVKIFLFFCPKNRHFVDNFFFLGDTASTAIGEGTHRI
jgi:hypothetical protein